VSTFDPTALDKTVPPVYTNIYGPFHYSIEQVRLDVKNHIRTFVAYTMKSVEISVKVEETKVCAGTNLDWHTDYWYKHALYIEPDEYYFK
jgi:hypothetical protein